MGKILLMLAAISVLIFSARFGDPRTEQPVASRSASVGAALSTLSRGFDGVSSLNGQQAGDTLLADQGDGPAAALLVYLAVILVGSVFGVAMTRRIPREL